MEKKEFHWLSHLENSIPESARGYTMSMYSIALEGWRRGLTLKYINKNRSRAKLDFILSSKENSYKFVVSRGELITRDAMKICKNKFEAKEYLQENNVPTPKGKLFDRETENDEIIAYAKLTGYPLVIKPSDGTGGTGVIAGIKNENEFTEALTYVREKLGFKTVIVEDYFKGEDYRVYVIDNEVIGVIKRIPANIVGDGTQTISKLIKQKNNLRRESPILNSSLIKVDQELHNMLKQSGYNMDTVPPKSTRVFLKSKNNISAGGDPVDITNDISDEVKQVAIDGVNAIPGLPHGGVDLMVDVEANKATVIEINTQASIRTHLFPMIGEARDVPSKLIDFYFPETKKIQRESLLYFDIEPIWKLFNKGVAKEYVYPNVPQNNVQATRFLISGNIHGVNYGKWIRRQARDLDLNGYVKFSENNKVTVIVAGNNSNIESFRSIVNSSSSKRADVTKVIEKNRTTPVKLGFRIINAKLDRKLEDGYFPVKLEGIAKIGQNKKRKGQNKKRKGGKKIDDYEKKYNNIIESKSWKLTRPLRVFRSIIKR